MNIKWRLGICAVELAILAWLSKEESNAYFSAKPWFAAAFAVIINSLLLEPFFPRPVDVIANAIAFVILAETTTRSYTELGWFTGEAICLVALTLAVFGLVAGGKDNTGRVGAIASSARLLSQTASAKLIFSAAFFLSAIEAHPTWDHQFWKLTLGWVFFLLVGSVNWQKIWASATGKPDQCTVEGMFGPANLVVSAPNLPPMGSSMLVAGAGSNSAVAILTSRIRRRDDFCGVLHMGDAAVCELLVRSSSLSLEQIRGGAAGNADSVIGAVDAGSSDRKILFVTLRDLTVGTVVTVRQGNENVLYQLTSAQVERVDVKGGGQLVIRANGVQLGIFDRTTLHLRDHRWVPDPGARVFDSRILESCAKLAIPAGSIVIGNLLGTDVPILLDLAKAREGHLAILGMTKMGKSTLATRLAKEFGKTATVVVMDQTGEYVGKKGLSRCDGTWTGNDVGLTVFEPKVGEVPADRALACLKRVVELGVTEYAAGTPKPRVVIIDEAHQFIPEPAGMGFGAPGRDNAIQTGLLMMQVRKFGISVILISQRTAVVSKSALSQCENVIAFRSVDQTGLDYLEAIVGGESSALLPKLRQAEALVFGPAISCNSAVVVGVAK